MVAKQDVLLPTFEQVSELLSYESETGLFVWKDRLPARGVRMLAGSLAGYLTPVGYIEIGLLGRRFPAHRLALLLVTGAWPVGDVDHINGQKADNRVANLRPASRSQNMQNRGAPRSNVSGHKGVHWCATAQKWRASISVDYKTIKLGRFDTVEAAHAAYQRAAELHHGEFANAG